MNVTQEHISGATPMGANVLHGGATFRVWAPRAQAVHIVGRWNGVEDWQPTAANQLHRQEGRYWVGFVKGAREGDLYKFFVRGEARESLKRDPYARELSSQPAYPHSACVLRDRHSYRWRATDWRTPPFHELVIYQFHIGTFAGKNPAQTPGTLLDALDRIEHWVAAGINAVEPLPIVEFSSPRSMGYDGSDMFSPEMDYTLEGAAVAAYLPRLNERFARFGKSKLTLEELAVPINQLKVFVDLCHLYGIAVVLDVVYNHVGGNVRAQQESLWFFDCASGTNANDSLYFTDHDHTGPVFAMWKEEVRQFLIDNTRFFLEEYRVDGFRYDHADVIVEENQSSGWLFCQNCTSTARAVRPEACQMAEYWPVDAWVPKPAEQGGAGFDATWNDRFRECVRGAIGSASAGRDAFVDMGSIADSLWLAGLSDKWRGVQCVESHDEVYRGRGQRLPRLADGANPRSWYARSRARVATGLLLTAPGIPLLFMGQEFLEDKQWADDATYYPGLLLDWAGLQDPDGSMADHLRFVGDLARLRRSTPALCGEGLHVITADNLNRVLAFQRWVEGLGRDVVVIASLNDNTLYGYEIGMPAAGAWRERFNSDVYDHFPNPRVAGNAGWVNASGAGLHGLPTRASLTIPANALLVLGG